MAVNGIAYSFQDIEMSIDDTSVTKFKSIDYKQTIDQANEETSEDFPGDFTVGDYKGVEGSITMTRDQYDSVASVAGWLQKQFALTVAYGNSGKPFTLDEMPYCKWTGDEHKAEKGPDALTVTMPFKARIKLTNGVAPVLGWNE